jgi:2',3'-cyclic-nucleotide 2'-phosphodiesterase (5'-nucleotidase family)
LESNVLTLHAGDVFIGDFFFNVYFGSAEFQLLNFIGIDAMAVGNHEWDLTPATLYGSLQASFPPGEGFPLLSANTILDEPEVQPLQDYIKPFTIKQIGNIKAGIFGLTTPETNLTSLPEPAIISDDVINIAAAMVDTLSVQNCDVIILLSHLGLYLDQLVAASISGIDIIVGGHDHFLLDEPVEILNPVNNKTLIVQAGSHYMYMGKLRLIVDSGEVSLLDYQMIHLDESVPEPVAIKVEVDELIEGIETVYGPVYTQQICSATEYFGEVADSIMYPGNHDTPVGNLVTDAFRFKTWTDIAVEAGGSTAQPFYQGPIVAADAFRVVGYGFNEVNGLGFRIVTFDILGADLWEAIETCLTTIELNDEFFPQVSGMKYVYNPNLPPGSRLISVTIDGNSLDPSAAYSVTGNELLAGLLTDYFEIPISNFFLYDSLSEFQVIAEYIALQQTITPIVEGRIIADISIDVEDENIVVKNFVLKQNYPNPFNPTTNFEFRISNFELVTLIVYDILGNEIATIVNEELPVGTYKYTWDASGLASGVYFYKLQAGNFVETKKLILLR